VATHSHARARALSFCISAPRWARVLLAFRAAITIGTVALSGFEPVRVADRLGDPWL